MNVKRVISVYEKDGEKLLSEYLISSIPLDRLKEIIKAKDDDPELYQVYSLGEVELLAFATLIPKMKELDSVKIELFYECFTE